MPIDPSIILGIRPVQVQQQDPLEQYGKSLTLKNLMGQGELQSMQMNKAKRDMADEEMYREAVKASGGSLEKLIPELTGRGLGRQAMDAQGKLMTNKKTEADYNKTRIQTQLEQAKYLRDRLAGVRDQAGYDQWRQEGAAMGAQVVNSAPEVFDPNFQQQQILTADKFLERMTPKYERVDLGGKVQVIDVNPFTNPSIKGTALDKTATPGDLMTDKRTRDEGAANRGVTIRGQNLTDTRARETGGRSYDSERGVVVDTKTGTAVPVTMGGAPLPGKLSESQRKELSSIDSQTSQIEAALKSVDANKDAFSFTRGMATMAGGLPETLAGRLDTDSQRQARSYVFNVVSKVINERAGAAQSAQELARLRSFLPAEADNAEQIKSKLEAFKGYLSDSRAGYDKPQTGAPKPAAPKQEERKVIGNKAYIKRNGQWYEANE
ncbi:MAG: hypothetical protein WC100_05885 [Sterolibacterium sp.]